MPTSAPVPVQSVYWESPTAVHAMTFRVLYVRELDEDVRRGDGTNRAYDWRNFRDVSTSSESKLHTPLYGEQGDA